MKDCIKTTLKGSVNNDNLIKLNEIKLFMAGDPGASTLCILLPTENNKANITTYDGVFSSNQQHTKEVLRNNSGMFGIIADLGKTVVKCSVDYKYVLEKLQDIYPNDFTDLGYCPVFEIGNTALRVTNAVANAINEKELSINDLLSWQNKLLLTKISYYFYGTNCTTKALEGNLSSLAEFANLTTIELVLTKVTGELKDLGSLTSLSVINFDQTNGVTGSIEDFVRVQYAKGRTTESTGISISASNVTFNDAVLSGNNTLTWQPNSLDNSKIDVTVGNTTITIDA